MAGYDGGEDGGPALYWCDYLATLHHMNICGTGYGELIAGRMRSHAMAPLRICFAVVSMPGTFAPRCRLLLCAVNV